MMNYYEIVNYLVVESANQDLDGFQITEYEQVSDIDDYKFWNDFYNKLNHNHRYIAESKYQEDIQLNIQPTQLEETAKLVAWIVRWLNQFSKSDASKMNSLSIILEITSFLDNKEGYFWDSLFRHRVLSNNALCVYIKSYLSSLGSKHVVNNNVPIHERESLEKFNHALNNKKWDEIAIYWKMFNTRPLLKGHEIQMIRILDYFRAEYLIEIYNECNDFNILMSVMYSLRLETSLNMGLKTDNEYLDFSIVYAISSGYNDQGALSEKEDNLLSNILSDVAICNEKFTLWMSIFNKYPNRFPNMQIALGRTLAKTKNKQALKIYIDSLNLTASSYIADDAVCCLKSFINVASNHRAKDLWEIAYKCWKEWNFGNNGLFKISFSQLDFGVIGYYRYCCTVDEKDEKKAALISQLSSITNKWYSSVTDLYTQWYINLSIFQLIEHSSVLESEGRELSLSTNQYIPNQFHENIYIELLLR